MAITTMAEVQGELGHKRKKCSCKKKQRFDFATDRKEIYVSQS